MGGHAGQPHGCLLGQVGAAVAVMRAGGMGMGTAGPGVAAVDAVQAAVRGKRRGRAWRRAGRGEEGNGQQGAEWRKAQRTSSASYPGEAVQSPGRAVKDKSGW